MCVAKGRSEGAVTTSFRQINVAFPEMISSK